MVAGKVKAAMGFQRSPATPKTEHGRRSSSSPASNKHSAASGTTASLSGGKNAGAAAFGRSFGVYFPKSSAQVQPRPPDVADLVRLVEDLQERESRLRTELLEYKLLKEAASIVPFLESQISLKEQELDLSKQSVERLEAENREGRLELEELKARIEAQDKEGKQREKKIREMEVEIEDLRRIVAERSTEEFRRFSGEIDEWSSSQRFQGLIDASTRSNLVKNLRKSPKSSDIASNPDVPKSEPADSKGDDGESEPTHPRDEMPRTRAPRVPRPPPTPSNSSSSSSSSSISSSCSSETAVSAPTVPAPPPVPPPLAVKSKSGAMGPRGPPPPPPPPPKARGSKCAAASVRRVPEVVEFYHSLMRRDSKRESGAGVTDAPTVANARNMIGEIENRSAHLLAIKTDVETQGDFIRFLIKEVNNAAFTNIEDLVAFVKWLDEELSFLVDERAVLKHFDWPEAKADAMREAAFGYCDLKKLESEASSFRDDARQPCSSALKKMQAVLEKLEHVLYNLARVREGATKRYKGFRIPWEWMLESGIVSQIKLASVKLAMKYMKRVSSELEATGGGLEEEDLMLQGVRFAFRVHQFAGGFDVETMRAFQELKDKASSFHLQNQSQHHRNKTYCRSTSC